MFDPKLLLDQLMGAGGARTTAPGQGGFGGMAGQVLDMARQHLGGAQGAGQVPATTRPGSVPSAGRSTGEGAGGDFMTQARDLMAGNQLATGALLGGLGGLMLGSKVGKGLMKDAVKLGGVAVIGGLAYKAYQNYQAGKAVPAPAQADAAIAPPPSGSGFEPQRATDQTALLLIRAMIAAASADGVVDATERARILEGVRRGGLDSEAAQWLDHELANPASVDVLARGVTDEETAAQVYTAARIAIDPDHVAEKRFLAALAAMLGLAPDLVAHIEATAEAALRQG